MKSDAHIEPKDDQKDILANKTAWHIVWFQTLKPSKSLFVVGLVAVMALAVHLAVVVLGVVLFAMGCRNRDRWCRMDITRKKAVHEFPPRCCRGAANRRGGGSRQGCVAVLLVSMVGVVQGVFTPNNNAELVTAVNACIQEDPEGSCPIYAAANNRGAMRDWNTAKVTSMTARE